MKKRDFSKEINKRSRGMKQFYHEFLSANELTNRSDMEMTSCALLGQKLGWGLVESGNTRSRKVNSGHICGRGLQKKVANGNKARGPRGENYGQVNLKRREMTWGAVNRKPGA